MTSTINSLRKLAGIPEVATTPRALFEVVQLPADASLEDLMTRLDACKRALAIVNGMKDPADRRKWLRATFINLNKVRGAMQRVMRAEGIDDVQ